VLEPVRNSCLTSTTRSFECLCRQEDADPAVKQGGKAVLTLFCWPSHQEQGHSVGARGSRQSEWPRGTPAVCCRAPERQHLHLEANFEKHRTDQSQAGAPGGVCLCQQEETESAEKRGGEVDFSPVCGLTGALGGPSVGAQGGRQSERPKGTLPPCCKACPSEPFCALRSVFKKPRGWTTCKLVECSRRARVLQQRDAAAVPLSLKVRIREKKRHPQPLLRLLGPESCSSQCPGGE
jgi:hypothetical protein